MLLSFTLSMPRNNAWNGKWSGDTRNYVVVRNIGSTKKKIEKATTLSGQSFYHNFGDGWAARIDVEIVDSSKARKLRNKSDGFCGYDWMIDSILSVGKIEASSYSRNT